MIKISGRIKLLLEWIKQLLIHYEIKKSLQYFFVGLGMQIFINMNILNATHKLYLPAFVVSHLIGLCWVLMIRVVNTHGITLLRIILTLNMGNALGTVVGMYLHSVWFGK